MAFIFLQQKGENKMDKTFQMQVNSAPQTKLDFPVGTRIFIESISDGSYPNAVENTQPYSALMIHHK